MSPSQHEILEYWILDSNSEASRILDIDFRKSLDIEYWIPKAWYIAWYIERCKGVCICVHRCCEGIFPEESVSSMRKSLLCFSNLLELPGSVVYGFQLKVWWPSLAISGKWVASRYPSLHITDG